MNPLHSFLRVLRLLPQPQPQGVNDVSIRGPRLQPLLDRAGAAGKRAARSRLLRWAALGALGVVLLAVLVWLLPPFARNGLIVATQVGLLRVGDVVLGVFRTTFIVRARTLAAAVTAGLESLVWITAASVVLSEISVARVLGFAAGVAIGTAIGVAVVSYLRLGIVTVRVFAPEGRGEEAASVLRAAGQGATVFPGRGRDGPVEMVLSVMRRREADAACAPLVAQRSFYVAIEGREANPRPSGPVGPA
jgi:uncharacterized protein YebE (UPF0316 family)